MDQSSPEQKNALTLRIALVLLAISVITNIFLITQQQYPDLLNRMQLALIPAPTLSATDHTLGDPKAKNIVFEYSDFQCPYCVAMHEDMRSIMKDTDTLWVYRHFPIARHPLAAKAAEAAECAGEQSKFWEYNDALFGLRGRIAENSFVTIARDLNLNTVSFGECLSSGRMAKTVADQRNEGLKKKITGTPTVFVNGERFDGYITADVLRKLLKIGTK